MSPEQFAYWLQGFVELNGGKPPTPAQWKSIKEHLGEVFTKVTPPVEAKAADGTPDDIRKFLDEVQRERRRPSPYPKRLC